MRRLGLLIGSFLWALWRYRAALILFAATWAVLWAVDRKLGGVTMFTIALDLMRRVLSGLLGIFYATAALERAARYPEFRWLRGIV